VTISQSILSSTPVRASFRDPAGKLLRIEQRIVRIVENSASPHLAAFLSSKTAAQFSGSGRLVNSHYVEPDEARRILFALNGHVSDEVPATVVEHELIPFPSFPYEWPPEMLAAAGNLTLDIAEGLLEEGLGLKDASPYNVLFRGPRPVFIDVLSAECRQPDDPTWLPYAQFVRMFVLPLLVYRFCGVPTSLYLAGRGDGIEPEEVYRLLSFFDRLRNPALVHVTLPTWLAKIRDPEDMSIYRRKSLRKHTEVQFVLRSIFRSLRSSLTSLEPRQSTSRWTDYAQSHSYAPGAFEAKRGFVEKALTDFPAARVLDAGCNTGFFSAIAARTGSSVVAIDSDAPVVGMLWRNALRDGLDILPLVVNMARPSPAVGWRNQEWPSFLERSHNRFDAVLMLALIHHLTATEGIPVSEIFRMAKDLTRRYLLIEYIDPSDPMFKKLVRGRETLFASLSRQAFEASANRFFDIVRSQQLTPERHLYVMVKRNVH